MGSFMVTVTISQFLQHATKENMTNEKKMNLSCSDRTKQAKHKTKANQILPTPGEAKAKAMSGRLYIHTINNK